MKAGLKSLSVRRVTVIWPAGVCVILSSGVVTRV